MPLSTWILCVFVLLSAGLANPRTGHAKTSPMASPPEWNWLAACGNSLTKREFQHALQDLYTRDGAAEGWIEIRDDCARIRTESDTWIEVPFVVEGGSAQTGLKRYWRRAVEMGPAPTGKPLLGVKIAIDPGHLGGEWAQMEERFFQIGKSKPVVEGDLTLAVAKRLKPVLEQLGAQVLLLRKDGQPTTSERPASLQASAAAELEGSITPDRLRRQSELLFYRISEIRARAQLVNEVAKPDLVLCLHMNAEEWGEPDNPQLQPRNHLHALVNGCYGAREVAMDDIRSEMLAQLFGRIANEAIPLSECVVESLAEETGLPPFTYFSNNASRVGDGPYLYARNLLANRLYKAPVVFLEPYVMNSGPVWRRIQMGDYSGQKLVDGILRKSLVAEYAAGVAGGLARYYRKARPVTNE